jgi:O-antigen/teichoic acid export membrane protein
VFKSFFWDFFSKISTQLIGFIVSIFLTRLLLPEEFGIMGIALVVISFSAIFVDLGFGKAIIQQKEITDAQLSTIFFLNLAISFFFTLIVFFLAHPAAIFFRLPRLEMVLKVISVSFIFYGLNVVPTALLYRKMNFRVISIISIVAVLLSGIIGVYMAMNGYGVWSLVAQNLVAGFLTFFLTFLYLKWLPQFIIIISQVRAMWKYSSRLFVSALLDTTFTRIDVFLIGRIFSPATLGYYTRAQSMDGVIRQISSSSIVSVLFPYISREQSNTEKVRELYMRYLHIISFVAFFLSGFLYVCTDSIFVILFTSKWTEAAALFKIMTIAAFVYPVSALMVSILSARGNSKAFLKAEIIKKGIILPVYLFGFFIGLHGFVYCLAGAYILALSVNALFVKKEISVPVQVQLKIVLQYGLISAGIVLLMYLLKSIFLTGVAWEELTLQALAFSFLFILFHAVSGTQGYSVIFKKVKASIKK